MQTGRSRRCSMRMLARAARARTRTEAHIRQAAITMTPEKAMSRTRGSTARFRREPRSDPATPASPNQRPAPTRTRPARRCSNYTAQGSDADDDQRGRDCRFGLKADHVDEGRDGEDRAATAECSESNPDEKAEGQGEEEPHTTFPFLPSGASRGRPAFAQALIPPSRLTASKPERTSRAVAWEER